MHTSQDQFNMRYVKRANFQEFSHNPSRSVNLAFVYDIFQTNIVMFISKPHVSVIYPVCAHSNCMMFLNKLYDVSKQTV